jgi:3-phenylpropionate/trans-cinnamate dioxygenase ferredoxin subunit
MAEQLICTTEELAVGEKKFFLVGKESIIVYHLADGFYATQRYCSHTFAPLEGGKLVEGCQIQCPFHRARFDVRTGSVVQWANFPPGIQMLNAVRNEKPLKTYAVQVRDGKVFVDC